MKVGFTPRETYNMFRSLRREVFDYFGYEHPLTFGVRDRKSGIFSAGTIAQCDFSDDPDLPWQRGNRINKRATGIRVDAGYLPHLHEDELICILLHELTHATAGYEAAHGAVWQRQAEEVGAIPLPAFVIRNWKDVYPSDHDGYQYAMRLGPTMEVYNGRY